MRSRNAESHAGPPNPRSGAGRASRQAGRGCRSAAARRRSESLQTLAAGRATACDREREHLARVEAPDPGQDRVQGVGVAGRHEDAQGAGVAGAGTVSLHADDGVQDGEAGRHHGVDVEEEPGEVPGVLAGAEVPLRLLHAHDGAEAVLDRRGHHHLSVSLGLGEVDHQVRVEQVSASA